MPNENDDQDINHIEAAIEGLTMKDRALFEKGLRELKELLPVEKLRLASGLLLWLQKDALGCQDREKWIALDDAVTALRRLENWYR